MRRRQLGDDPLMHITPSRRKPCKISLNGTFPYGLHPCNAISTSAILSLSRHNKRALISVVLFSRHVNLSGPRHVLIPYGAKVLGARSRRAPSTIIKSVQVENSLFPLKSRSLNCTTARRGTTKHNFSYTAVNTTYHLPRSSSKYMSPSLHHP